MLTTTKIDLFSKKIPKDKLSHVICHSFYSSKEAHAFIQLIIISSCFLFDSMSFNRHLTAAVFCVESVAWSS